MYVEPLAFFFFFFFFKKTGIDTAHALVPNEREIIINKYGLNPRVVTLQSSLPQEQDESSLPTIESVAAAKKRRAELSSARESGSESESESTQQQSTIAQRVAETESPASTPAAASATDAKAAPAASQSLDSSPGELEEEADQESAFNPETGEINWDCPCLGGMAHGPCGEEFRSAFSCFVYSTEEPKGMDCIDNFKYVFLFLSLSSFSSAPFLERTGKIARGSVTC